MLDYLEKIHDYNFWANKTVHRALAQMNPPDPKGLKILGHIIFGMDVWLARLRQEDLSRFKDGWPSYSMEECGVLIEKLHGEWVKEIRALDPSGLSRKISYVNTKGQRYECAIGDVLIHVVDHGTYHRGQMATAIHQGGGKGASTGYYAFTLEKA